MNIQPTTSARQPGRLRRRICTVTGVAVLLLGLPAVADAATRNGTDNNDRLVGTKSSDVIFGLGGDDQILAGKGNDRIEGGDGNDVIRAEKGEDVVDAGSGNDFVDGGKGEDRISGGPGDDSIQGGKGDDRIDGGPGNDRLQGQGNTDIYTFSGNFGNDLVIDSSGNKDLLSFPDVDLASVRVERKGKDNLVIVTPNGTVEIADQFGVNECETTKNGEPNIEGFVFRDADAELRGDRLVEVKSIKKTNCGRSLPDFRVGGSVPLN